MKNARHTITLYTHRMDSETGYDLWSGQVFQGVSVFGSTAVSVSKDGFGAADVYTVRVPESAGEFSCHAGDLIVLGEAMEPDPRPANLEKKYQTLTVVGCTDNRGKREPHWKVIAK